MNSAYNNIVVPKSVSYNGIKYDVEKVCEYTFYHVAMESLSFPDNISLEGDFISDVNINKLYLPKNLSVLQSNLFNHISRSGNPGGITGINELHINEGLKKIKMFSTWGEGYPKRIIGFATSNIELNSSSKCNGIHINNLFKFFVWCEVSKSFTRSII